MKYGADPIKSLGVCNSTTPGNGKIYAKMLPSIQNGGGELTYGSNRLFGISWDVTHVYKISYIYVKAQAGAHFFPTLYGALLSHFAVPRSQASETSKFSPGLTHVQSFMSFQTC